MRYGFLTPFPEPLSKQFAILRADLNQYIVVRDEFRVLQYPRHFRVWGLQLELCIAQLVLATGWTLFSPPPESSTFDQSINNAKRQMDHLPQPADSTPELLMFRSISERRICSRDNRGRFVSLDGGHRIRQFDDIFIPPGCS